MYETNVNNEKAVFCEDESILMLGGQTEYGDYDVYVFESDKSLRRSNYVLLHEIGHTMDLKHQPGIMSPTLVGTEFIGNNSEYIADRTEGFTYINNPSDSEHITSLEEKGWISKSSADSLREYDNLVYVNHGEFDWYGADKECMVNNMKSTDFFITPEYSSGEFELDSCY
jgi:hypothetical protein